MLTLQKRTAQKSSITWSSIAKAPRIRNFAYGY